DVTEVEPDRLGAAEAGRVNKLDERAVAEIENPIARQRGEDPVHLLRLRRGRQPARPARRERCVRRVLRSEWGTEQAANCCEPPRDRAGCEAAAAPRAAELGDVLREHAHVDVLERLVPVPGEEVTEVAAI